MKYQEIMSSFSQSGMGALVLSRDGVILSINQAGDRLLCGDGKLTGTQLIDIAGELGQTATKPVYVCVQFDHYVIRCPAPEAEGLPEGAQLIVFRDAVDDACHDMLMNVVNQLDEAVILCDEKSRIYMLNDAAEKMDALVTQDVRGCPISDIYFMRDGKNCGIPEVIRSKQSILNMRQYYTTCYGHDVDIVANLYPIVQDGQVLGASSIMVNINPAYRTYELEYALKQAEIQTLILQGRFKTSDYVGMFYEACPEAYEQKAGKVSSEKFPFLKNVVFMGDIPYNGMYEAITITTTRTIRILYPHFSQIPNAEGWQSWQNSDLQILQVFVWVCSECFSQHVIVQKFARDRVKMCRI